MGPPSPKAKDAGRTPLLCSRFTSDDWTPRCGSTIEIIVADLVGSRRCHIFSPTASFETFREALALARGVKDAAKLVVVHHGVIIDGETSSSRTLCALGLQDGSTVHAFAREPASEERWPSPVPTALRVRAATLDNSAPQPRSTSLGSATRSASGQAAAAWHSATASIGAWAGA